jgi:pimeloyl-ACP methyl ester carboxylesterase
VTPTLPDVLGELVAARRAVRARWRTADVDGAALRFLEAAPAAAGDSDAATTPHTLLFLHGWGLTPRAYADGVCRLTSAGVRVVAPCLPGFGGSDGPPLLGAPGRWGHRVDLPFYAQRVGRLLDVLGIEHPVFVVGHSFGGGVALQVATDRPERVRSLTLVNSVGGAPGRGGMTGGMNNASWLRWAVGALGELDPAEVARAAPGLLRDFLPNAVRKPVTLALTARLALTASLARQAEELVSTGVPVLFIWADADRLVARGEFADVVGSTRGQLPPEVVPGRHGWVLTRPEEFATLLRNALVVHAMLERSKRGHAVVLPPGTSLADLIPLERRSAARFARSGLVEASS